MNYELIKTIKHRTIIALPNVKINFKNGSIGGVEPMDDGVTLAIIPGLRLDADVDCLTYNDFVEKAGAENALVKAFFTEAGGKTRLIVSGKSPLTEANVQALIQRFNGDIRNVVTAGERTLAEINTLQAVGEWAATELFAPVTFFVTAASGVNPGTLSLNRVAVVDGVTDTEAEGGVPLLWYVAGHAAKIPVQRSLARVKDGALTSAEFWYTEGTGSSAKRRLVTNLYAEGRHNSGFITVRTFQGKTGYYISDDLMAAPASDDYALLPRRRTIDKAYRVAYQTLANYIGDEIPLSSTGRMSETYCKDMSNAVEQAIYKTMTVYGNLGTDTSDASDRGVRCYINPDQDVAATSRVLITLWVKPYGYAKYIEVDLGFDTTI